MDKTFVKRAAGAFGWVATMTCPHASFLVFQLNQLIVFDAATLKLVNMSVDRTLKFVAVGMRIKPMDLSTLYIAVNSDASLANNADLFSDL